MGRYRKHGSKPFTVAVLHGGPGALGDTEKIGEKLSDGYGVLEPLFDQRSIEEQVEWLKQVISREGNEPVALIGHSWGAWLAFIFTVKYSSLVRKLILVSSGPFEEKYVKKMNETILDRIEESEKKRYFELREKMESEEKDIFLKEYGELISKISAYDPIEGENDVEVLSDVNEKVWSEAEELRKSGTLLEMTEKVSCPVVAVHGEHDPHPYEGVKGPLSERLDSFKFILLEKCGHYPWKEKEAREEFYDVLRSQL